MDIKQSKNAILAALKKVQANESISEASLSKVHNAAKKGSYPITLVAIEDGKVVDQKLVGTPAIVPAAFNDMQREFPNAQVNVEDRTGKILFKEISLTNTVPVTERVASSKFVVYVGTKTNPTVHAVVDSKSEADAMVSKLQKDGKFGNIDKADYDGFKKQFPNKLKESTISEGSVDKEAIKKLKEIILYMGYMQNDGKYKPLAKKIARDVYTLMELVSLNETVDKTNSLDEAKFHRLPSKLNVMWDLKNSINHMVDKHDNGDDYDPAEMKTIEEFIKKIKKSAKAFNGPDDVKGTVYESVNEAGNLLKQNALSPGEYQKAKKLKGFDSTNYTWDNEQDLYIISKTESVDEMQISEINVGDMVKIDKAYGGGKGEVTDKVGSFVIVNGSSHHESDVTLIETVIESFDLDSAIEKELLAKDFPAQALTQIKNAKSIYKLSHSTQKVYQKLLKKYSIKAESIQEAKRSDVIIQMHNDANGDLAGFAKHMVKLEKKLGKKNFRSFLTHTLTSMGTNGDHYDYRDNVKAIRKLHTLTAKQTN